MSDNRKTRAKKNIVTSFFSQIIVLICGIIVPRIMLGAFGSEAYGAVSSITQFLAYITLLEGGIGGVARAVLYKPLAENDINRISAIMGEIKRFFCIIAWIFAGYVLILACGFHSLSHITCMDWISTFILVVVISISTFGQYFIGISNSVLLQAAQKTYVTNIVSIGATVINAVSTIILVEFGCSLIIVKLVSSCIFFMRPVALWAYVRKNFSLNKVRFNKNQINLTQKWDGLGQHIAYFLHSNTDIAVLTVLADLKTVAVYAVYNMIVSHVQSFAISFSSGMEAVFGDMLARGEKKKLHDTFRTYETILSVVSIVLFSVTAVTIVPFVRLYTAGINDTEYVHTFFAVIMVLNALSYCLRLPYHAIVIAAGHFKETSGAAYGEAVINIVFSIILVFRFGLIGVALATFAATWFRFLYYVIYLSKNIFNRKITLFVKRFLINAVVIVCNCILASLVVSCFEVTNYLTWVIAAVVSGVCICAITLGINMIFFKNDCAALIKKVVKK